jgi:PhnB protein
MVDPVPAGYHTATPVLFVSHLTDAIEFYQQAFEATEEIRLWAPTGKLAGLEIRIGDSRIRILSEAPERDFRAPTSLQGRTGMVHLYLPNAQEVFERAQKNGATLVEPLNEQYWGDLCGIVEDPYGHRWFIAQHIEDLTAEEILSRGPTTPN